ncbi:MAG: hypothetical protein KGI90_09215 [Burkholderiales bacterium]|nr:hypothetical protein [Burkholderiales bacterium]
MHGSLFSIDKAPAALPIWDAIHNDLGRPPAARVAAVLGVGRSTVYRWHVTGTAPRAACLALFWLTRWGRSHLDAQATNDATLYFQLARALGEERDALRRQLAGLDAAPTAPAAATAPLAWPALVAPEQCPQGLAWPAIEPAEAAHLSYEGAAKSSSAYALWELRQAQGSLRSPSSTACASVPESSGSHQNGAHGSAGVALARAWGLMPPRCAWQQPPPGPDIAPSTQARGKAEQPAVHGALATRAASTTTAPAAGPGQGSQQRSAGVQPVARPGTPASAGHGAAPHTPDPGRGGAPPGAGVFAAIVQAACRPSSSISR